MSAQVHDTPWSLWRRNLRVWAALTALLALSYFAAYWPLGAGTTVIGIGIAVTKALLVGLIFMRIVRTGPLVWLAALAGLFWLAIMFALTFADVLERLSNR